MTLAMSVALYVKAFTVLLFWLLVGSATLAAFYLGMRGIWWALHLALEAIGL